METTKIKTKFSFESDLEMMLHIMESPLHGKQIWAADVAFRVLMELLYESLNTENSLQSIQVDDTNGYVVFNNDWFSWNISNIDNYSYITTIAYEQPDLEAIPNNVKNSIREGDYCNKEDLHKDMITCFKNAFARVTDSSIWINRREDCRTPEFEDEELEAIDLICYLYDRHSKLRPIDIDDTDISFALESIVSAFRKLIFNTNTIGYKLDVRQRDYIEVIIGEIERNAF